MEDFFKIKKEEEKEYSISYSWSSCVIRKNVIFATYVILMGTSTEKGVQVILTQYHDLENVFKKKNVDILLKYHLYDYTIELQDGVQPPFGSIYNLSQMKLATLIITFPIISFGIQNHLPEDLFCL